MSEKNYEYYYFAKRNMLPDAKNRTRIVGTLKKNSRVHVSAACGKAMASVTCMLANLGYIVTASDDACHPPMSDVLTAHNISCQKPSVENLEHIDVVVVGNTLPSSALEVVIAQEKGIPMMSGSEVLREILTHSRRSLVVAGTHGKTTTSSLLAHVFLKSGNNPAYMIGGSFQDTGKSYAIGSTVTSHVIFEGDEYDCAFFDKAPKFLRYNATSVIITSIEHDHIDLYPTFEDYKQAFQFLVDDIPENGFLILHNSVLQNIDISHCLGKIITYGHPNDADVSYTIDSVDHSGTTFSITYKSGEIYKQVFIPMFGEYNIANATAVFILARCEGLSPQEIIKSFATYPGVHERQEVIGEKNEITVIRDFAHHPTAVQVTLEGMRMHYPNRRLVCVFEPRSITSRKKSFETKYSEALHLADVSIVVTPPFREGDNKNDFIDVSVITKTLQSFGKIAYAAKDPNEALHLLSKYTQKQDVVVFMSNGDFGGIPEMFLKL